MESAANLTREAFERLLDCLDAERDGAAERYSRLRVTLIEYFTFERCPFPEDHADEVVMRVARRLGEGQRIERLPAYMLGVARIVAKETISRSQRAQGTLREFSLITRRDETPRDEGALRCLDCCLEELPA
ncbi:MAG: hypothetical protein ACRD8O_00325 [Bryobacteraceae bacterium]